MNYSKRCFFTYKYRLNQITAVNFVQTQLLLNFQDIAFFLNRVDIDSRKCRTERSTIKLKRYL
jgi:hypothetical protein